MAKKSRTRAPKSPPGLQHAQPPQQERRQPPKRSLLHVPLENELVAALLAKLPFRDVATDEPDRELLFARYLDSLAMLESGRQELLRLCDAMATASVQYEASLPATVCAEIEQRIKSELRVRLDPPGNLAGAELGALPVAEIRERLSQALHEACHKLMAQFLDGLVALLDRQLLGRAHWPGPNAVKYRFSRHVVRGHATLTTSTSQPLSTTAENGPGSRLSVTKHLRRTIQSMPVDISLECHQHDAISAFCTTIGNSAVVMPAPVDSLVEAIPAWMRPSIRIIDGYLIRERIDERSLTKTSVVTQVTEEIVTEYQQRAPSERLDTFVYGVEPAVLLGNFVLTGWGPREIEQATVAREQGELREAARNASRFWFGCAAALQIPTACFADGTRSIPPLPMLAVALFIGSIFCLAPALRNLLEHKATPVSELRYQRTMSGPVVYLAGLQLAALPDSLLWSLPGLLIVGVGVFLMQKSAATLFPDFPSRKAKP